MELNNELQRFSYALGVNIAGSLQNEGISPKDLDFDVFAAAVGHGLGNGNLLMEPNEINQAIQTTLQRLAEAKHAGAIEEGKAFLEANAKEEGVVALASGLQYKVIRAGDGPKPSASSTVTTHYHGTLIDGTVFDSSVQRGQPASFPVNGVISGWTEALQLMETGSKWRLFVPPHLAYGERGAGGAIGPHATLIFDVELISVN